METTYIIRTHTIVYIWAIVRWWIILPLTSVTGSLHLDILFAFGLGYIYCKRPLPEVEGTFAIYTSLYINRGKEVYIVNILPETVYMVNILISGYHKTMVQAGSRMPSLAVQLVVVATTCQIQTGPRATPGSTAWRVKLSLASVRVVPASCWGAVFV